MSSFLEKARTVNECLHAYGIHSATLQPETVVSSYTGTRAEHEDHTEAEATATGHGNGNGSISGGGSSLRRRTTTLDPAACQIICSNLCHNLMCCTKIES